MSTLYYTFGIGTAKNMREFLASTKKSDMFVCIIPPKEFMPPLLQDSKEEMEEVLTDNRLIVLAGNSLAECLVEFQRKVAIVQLMTEFKPSPMPVEIRAEFPRDDWTQAFEEQVKNMASMCIMLHNTSKRSVRNYFVNAYDSLANQNWDGVAAKVTMPCVLIGMGPSMAYEIENLKKLRGKVHIICVDNALRYLAHHGIQPDVVLQVEWTPISLGFYKGVKLKSDTLLVVLSGVCPDVLTFWKGPKLFMPNYQVMAAFEKFINKTTEPFFGTNVGTLAVQFVDRVYAREAWLVGYDFGSPRASYFHPGSVNLHEIYSTVTRFWSVHTMDYQYNLKHHGSVELPDRHGKPMIGIESFESDRRSIESLVLRSRTKFYNASADGRPVDGAEYRPLSDLVEQVKDSSFRIGQNLAPAPWPLDKEALAKECQIKLEELETYQKLSNDIFQAAEELQVLMEHGHQTPTALKKFCDAVDAVQAIPELGWVEGLISSLEPSIRHIFSAETLKARELTTQSERSMAWSKVVRQYYPLFATYYPFLVEFLTYTKNRALT